MRKTVGRFVNSSTQTVANNSSVLFANNTLSTNALAYDGDGGILIKVPGIYMVYANFTTAATATGSVQITLQENGVSVPGASATSTADTIGDYSSLSFTGIVTVKPNFSDTFATLSFNNTNATSVSTANVIIEKVA